MTNKLWDDSLGAALSGPGDTDVKFGAVTEQADLASLFLALRHRAEP